MVISGTLERHAFLGWKERFFRLDGRKLSYAKSCDQPLRKHFTITGVTRTAALGGELLGLDIECEGTTEVLKVRAFDARTLYSWYDAMVSALAAAGLMEDTNKKVPTTHPITNLPLLPVPLEYLSTLSWLDGCVLHWIQRVFIMEKSLVMDEQAQTQEERILVTPGYVFITDSLIYVAERDGTLTRGLVVSHISDVYVALMAPGDKSVAGGVCGDVPSGSEEYMIGLKPDFVGVDEGDLLFQTREASSIVAVLQHIHHQQTTPTPDRAARDPQPYGKKPGAGTGLSSVARTPPVLGTPVGSSEDLTSMGDPVNVVHCKNPPELIGKMNLRRQSRFVIGASRTKTDFKPHCIPPPRTKQQLRQMLEAMEVDSLTAITNQQTTPQTLAERSRRNSISGRARSSSVASNSSIAGAGKDPLYLLLHSVSMVAYFKPLKLQHADFDVISEVESADDLAYFGLKSAECREKLFGAIRDAKTRGIPGLYDENNNNSIISLPPSVENTPEASTSSRPAAIATGTGATISVPIGPIELSPMSNELLSVHGSPPVPSQRVIPEGTEGEVRNASIALSDSLGITPRDAPRRGLTDILDDADI